MVQLVPFLKKKLQQAEQGIANIGAAPHPVQISSPEVVQKIQNAKYGVLAQGNNRNNAIATLNRSQADSRPSAWKGIDNLAGAMGDTANKLVLQPFVTKPAMEIAQSARDVFNGKKQASYTPGSQAEKYLFGDTRVDSVQKKVSDQYNRDMAGTKTPGAFVDTSGIRKTLARPLAIGEAGLSILNDAPVVGVVGKGIVKGTKLIAPKAGEALEAAGKAALPVAKQTVTALKAEKQNATIRQGAKQTVINEANRVEKAAQALDKKQLKYPDQSESLQRQAEQLRVRGQELRNSVVKQPLVQNVTDRLLTATPGLSMKAVHSPELNPEQNQFIEEYATMLKDMGQGNGVDILADGRRVSNNVRDANVKGEQLNNSYWFDKARQELESGRAAYGASEEYKTVGQIVDQPPLEIPAGFEGPTVTASPPKKQLPVSAGEAKPAPKVPTPAKPVVPDVKSSSNGKATNRLTQGGRDGRQELAPEVQGAIKGEHVQRNTAQLGAKANADISKLDDQTAIQAAHDRLNVDLGKIDDKDVAFTNEAIQRAQNAGRMEDAINLHDKLSEHLVKTGQTSQAASLLYRLSPDGIFYKAVRDLKKSGKEVTPELQTELKQQADAIKNATGTEAKQRATVKLGKTVADNIPKGRMNDILSVWKAGLLSGVKTQQGNAISNATFGVLKKISDVPSAAVDKGISLITGQRTKVATGKGIVSGGKEGIRKGIDTLKTGIDERNITGGKYEQHGELNFKNPIIQKIFGDTSNMVFRGMSAADQPFYYAAAKNNLYDLGLAEASNRGLKGTEKSSFVRNFVDNPPKSAAQRSKDAADKAVLGYDTVASKIISGAHQVIDRVAPSPAAKATAHTVVGVLAPFVKVPSAFISRTIDFTPAGPFKEAVNQISNKKFDQRALSEAIGQGITGTGVIALGVSLAQNKLISGNYPKSDPKEAQRWKAEGITPNSVKIGNKWISMNYLGPVGLLFNAGKQFHDAEDSAALGKVAASVGGIGQGLLGQSFLQGFSGFSDAINDPERNAKSFVNSQASSAIPAWVNDIANVTDKFQRQADTVGESIKNRIPVLRGDNKIKQDVYGNQLEQPAGQLNTLNGVKPSNSLTNKNPVVAEVSRLHDVDTKNPDLQVTPSQVQKTVTVNKETIKLDDKQRYDLQTAVGKATTDAWGKLIKTDEYKALDDTGKAKALSNLRTDTATLATREFVTSNNIGIYDKGVTDKLAKLGTNHENVASYAQSGSTSTSSTSAKSDLYKSNDAEYRQLVSKYEENKKAGTLSTASDIRAKDAISRAKVGKDYSKDTRDLYGLTKQQILSYISTNRDGNKIADDLKAYDQALYNAGLSTSLKFKNGFTSASKSSGKSGSTKFKVASLPKLSNRSVKIPKLRTPKVKLAKLTNKKAVYRSAKIASNVNAKLRLKTA